MEKELSLRVIDNLKDKFTPIYKDGKEVNPVPEKVKVTVYCEGTNESGYLTNIFSDEGGFEMLIAKSWILEKDLRALAENV